MSVISDATIGDRTFDDPWDRPLALDLFAGAGGACRGLQTYGHRGPGWEVIGIDADPRKVRYYPDVFVEHDLTKGLPEFVDDYADQIEVVWASAPCMFATDLQFARSGDLGEIEGMCCTWVASSSNAFCSSIISTHSCAAAADAVATGSRTCWRRIAR